MVDINRYILNNVHFPRKKLVDHVLQYHDYNFKNLLKVMEEKTGVKPEEMLTYEAWEKWDEDQRAKLHSSLSYFDYKRPPIGSLLFLFQEACSV